MNSKFVSYSIPTTAELISITDKDMRLAFKAGRKMALNPAAISVTSTLCWTLTTRQQTKLVEEAQIQDKNEGT